MYSYDTTQEFGYVSKKTPGVTSKYCVIVQQWKPACSGHMFLVLDVHKAQTEAIQDSLKEQCNTYPVYVPAGTTSIVQLIDVVFNTPFNAAVEREDN